MWGRLSLFAESQKQGKAVAEIRFATGITYLRLYIGRSTLAVIYRPSYIGLMFRLLFFLQ